MPSVDGEGCLRVGDEDPSPSELLYDGPVTSLALDHVRQPHRRRAVGAQYGASRASRGDGGGGVGAQDGACCGCRGCRGCFHELGGGGGRGGGGLLVRLVEQLASDGAHLPLCKVSNQSKRRRLVIYEDCRAGGAAQHSVHAPYVGWRHTEAFTEEAVHARRRRAAATAAAAAATSTSEGGTKLADGAGAPVGGDLCAAAGEPRAPLPQLSFDRAQAAPMGAKSLGSLLCRAACERCAPLDLQHSGLRCAYCRLERRRGLAGALL